MQENQLAPGTGPLYRYTNIAARLYQIPQYREQYHARVLALLDQVWDKDALGAEVDRIRDLTQTPEEEMPAVRAFIEQYEDKIRAEIAGETTQRERTIIDQPFVCDESSRTTISANIINGAGIVEWQDLQGNPVTVLVTALAPAEGSADIPGQAVLITLIGSIDNQLVIFPVLIEKSEFGRAEIPLHGSTTFVIYGQLSSDSGFQTKGATGAGTLYFDEMPEIGAPVTMRLSAEFVLNDRLFNFLGGL